MTQTDEAVFLYVEDDTYSREALEVIIHRVMRVAQEHFFVFEDSSDFLNRVRALPRKPDLFMLDIHVRPNNGFDMLKMLRADPEYANSRIVALTASVMNEEVELLKVSGFDGVIGKPINIASFPALVKRVLDGETIWHVTEM